MAGKKKKEEEGSGEQVVCRNRKASHRFHILETIEAGIVLTGTEVKSLRAGQASLEESYARVEGSEVWLIHCDIPEYAMGNRMNHVPQRKRKLLLHRREIAKFAQRGAERGLTLVPLRLYFHRGRAKVLLAMAKGKKLHDKRESLKERSARREMDRAMRAGRGKRGPR